LIFLTIGTHEPFDRLVRAVDEWCVTRGCGDRVFGQVTARAQYRPSGFESVATLDPDDYKHHFEHAELIVSHAGMGSIITAMTLSRPIVVVPRRGHLGETRNDHQVATAERFGGRSGVYVAADVEDLTALLDRYLDGEDIGGGVPVSEFAEERLISTVRDFIWEDVSSHRAARNLAV
jgi:UDP-N-acetylglucosamine transferase subunit ALG13